MCSESNSSQSGFIVFWQWEKNSPVEIGGGPPSPFADHNCTHRTITMAAIASINAVARVAAPKVRRDPSRAAPVAFSDRDARQYFRDETPAEADRFVKSRAPPLARKLTIPPAPSLPHQVTARRSFIGKGVAGLAPVR